jgi:flagella basal body P-ring formation protein FlgA
VPCDAEASAAALSFDAKASALRASGNIEAGAYLGRIAVPRAADVQAGQKLILRSTEGPVTVQRSVVALQPGRSGGRVFVRDADGEVSSAKLALSDEKEKQK